MKLYKYLSPDRADVLANRMMRFTQPGALNDPFEFKPHIAGLATESQFEDILKNTLPSEVNKIHQKLSPEEKQKHPLESLANLASRGLESQLPEIHQAVASLASVINKRLGDEIENRIGLLSLTETPDNLLMWSHYAQSHTGFVVGFNGSHRWFNDRRGPKDEFMHARQVLYSRRRPDRPLAEQDGTSMFLTKSDHWSYEREWRVLRPLENASKTIDADPFGIHLFEFPSDAVTDVIVGSRIDDATRSEIAALIGPGSELPHANFREATPDSKIFGLNLIDA